MTISYKQMQELQLSKRYRYFLALRAREVRLVIRLIGKEHKNILEIGGGNGWQAYLLKRKGFSVSSVDISHSTNEPRFSDVMIYDGRNLPFKDNSFDIIFSSNVLEHIPELDKFESEMHRVLKPNGYAIHILPTSSWRVLTTLLHPFWVLRAVIQNFRAQNPKHEKKSANGKDRNWLYLLWPNRHGVKGNSLSEIYWFSQNAWIKHFKQSGWAVLQIMNTSVAYTGTMAAHMYLSMATRRLIARYIGSSTKIYLMSH